MGGAAEQLAHHLRVKVSDVDRAECWFVRHGGKAVFFGRMIPLFRSVISLPAGIERMNTLRFLLLTGLDPRVPLGQNQGMDGARRECRFGVGDVVGGWRLRPAAGHTRTGVL